MAAPLVVHLGAPDRLARRLAGPPSALARQVAGTSPARADVLVLHGRRARRVPRGGLALVVRRPAPGERPSRADRASLRRTDIVVVRDPGSRRRGRRRWRDRERPSTCWPTTIPMAGRRSCGAPSTRPPASPRATSARSSWWPRPSPPGASSG
ncbi:MAG: hypothetical protein R2711_17635 [Acidimicrobiales bacterium]